MKERRKKIEIYHIVVRLCKNEERKKRDFVVLVQGPYEFNDLKSL
jgi:hypothetical protein